MVTKTNPALLQYFLPDSILFENFEPDEFGVLSKTNKLKDLGFLGTVLIPKIKLDYKKVACCLLDKCYG